MRLLLVQPLQFPKSVSIVPPNEVSQVSQVPPCIWSGQDLAELMKLPRGYKAMSCFMKHFLNSPFIE